MGQRNALAELLFSQQRRPTPNSLAALVGNADADLRAGIGTSQARDPTWRERAAGLLQDGIEALGADRYRARKIAETVMGGPSSNLPMNMGLLDPTMVGAAFGRQESPNLGPGAPSGLTHAATVFHGSPHRFEKFDSKKIGTGEGAQAYGHGLYLAENQAVAEGYRKGGHVNPDLLLDGEGVLNWALGRRDVVSKMPPDQQRALRLLIDHKDIAQARQAAEMDGLAASARFIDELTTSGRLKPGDPGSLYSVDLPDPLIARMLDWDKPLSQQAPAIQEAMRHKPAVYSGPEYTADELLQAMMSGKELPTRQQLLQPERISPLAQALGQFREKTASTKPPTGEQVYRALADQYGHDKAASMLREAGIPGIRYLDGGSRAGGAGTSNFVVFPGEESALRILERNGVKLP